MSEAAAVDLEQSEGLENAFTAGEVRWMQQETEAAVARRAAELKRELTGSEVQGLRKEQKNKVKGNRIARVEKQVLALVQGLGAVEEGGVYITTKQTKHNLKSLYEFLDHCENDNFEYVVSRKLARWNVFESHLVPMLASEADNEAMVRTVVTLMHRMTLSGGPVQYSVSRLESLQSCKLAIVNSTAIGVLTRYLAQPLRSFAKNHHDIEAYRYMDTILSLFRNLVAIPDPKPSQGKAAVEYADCNDRLLMQFSQEHVLEYIQVLCAVLHPKDGHTLALVLVELLCYVLQDEAYDALTTEMTSGARLSGLLRQESAEQHRARSHLSTRHSRFGGSVRKSKAMHVSVEAPRQRHAVIQEKPKDIVPTRRYQSDAVRLVLVDFIKGMVPEALGALVKAAIETCTDARSKHVVPSDYKHMFTVCAIFLDMYRPAGKLVRLEDIACLANTQLLQFCLQQALAFVESKEWSIVESIMRFYEQYLRVLGHLQHSKPEADRLVSALFSEDEYAKLILVQLKQYSPKKMALQHLFYLIGGAHYAIKCLDSLSKRRHNTKTYELDQFLDGLSCNAVVKCCLVVLDKYAVFSREATYAAILCLRIAKETEATPLFFQLRFLLIADRILNSASQVAAPVHELCRYIVTQFTAYASKNPLMLAEALFWKPRGLISDLNEQHSGGVVRRRPKGMSAGRPWTAEEDEIIRANFPNVASNANYAPYLVCLLHHRSEKQVVSRVNKLGLKIQDDVEMDTDRAPVTQHEATEETMDVDEFSSFTLEQRKEAVRWIRAALSFRFGTIRPRDFLVLEQIPDSHTTLILRACHFRLSSTEPQHWVLPASVTPSELARLERHLFPIS